MSDVLTRQQRKEHILFLLKASSMTFREIAEDCRVSRSYVEKLCYRNGIIRPSNPFHRKPERT